MADTSYPFDGQTISEAEWSKFARLFLGDGVVPFPSAAGTGYNTPLSVFADSSGLQVKQRAGVCAVQGFYFERSTDNTVIAISSNATGSTRIDRIVAKLDRAANTITMVAKVGTTSPPSLQQDATIWEISLAQVSVANGAVTLAAATVTDERKFIHRHSDGPYGLAATPKSSTSALTTSGGSVLQDTGVGDITFTADPNAFYELTYIARVTALTAGAQCLFEMRDGGTSASNNASTLKGATTVRITSTSADGASFVHFKEILGPGMASTLTAGVHNIGVYYSQNDVGSGSVTPDQVTGGSRKFYILNLGYVI